MPESVPVLELEFESDPVSVLIPELELLLFPEVLPVFELESELDPELVLELEPELVFDPESELDPEPEPAPVLVPELGAEYSFTVIETESVSEAPSASVTVRV